MTSVTVRGSDVAPAGRGGGGRNEQFTDGIVRIGPDVVCEYVVATVNVQSHAMMVPGAVDVLPLNVQLSVFPPFAISQVSVSDGPVTPKFATATVGAVTDSAADDDTPPNDAVMIVAIVPPTALVTTVNVALVAPAATVTLAGTVTGSLAVSVTTAPPDAAGPLSVTVPETVAPPTTVDAPRDKDESLTEGTTVSDVDC